MIIADSIRAMRTHIDDASLEERNSFAIISQSVLEKSENKLESQAASLLLLNCVSIGYRIPEPMLDKFLLKFKEKPLILPQIIEIAGYHDQIPPIPINGLDISFVNALMHNNKERMLLELYSESSNYSPLLTGQLIRNLAHFCGKLEFNTDNLGELDLNLVLAIVEYRVICEGDLGLLDSVIERGKGLNTLILLYSYFPEIAIRKIRNFALSGMKTHREAVLKCINAMKITSANKDEVVDLLKEMAVNEKIWHIRRDIRFTLSRIDTS